MLRRLRAAGLQETGIEGRAFIWPGGSTGATLNRLNYEQLRDSILATGLVTEEEFAAIWHAWMIASSRSDHRFCGLHGDEGHASERPFRVREPAWPSAAAS